jgi:single-strand DNA-binding protein
VNALNNVAITGNLTRDPVLKEINGGENRVVSFGVGRSRKKTDSDERVSEFYEVEAWGTLAGNIARSLRKGDPVCVVGKLRYDQYEVDDIKRNRTYLVASHAGPDLRYREVEVKTNGKE